MQIYIVDLVYYSLQHNTTITITCSERINLRDRQRTYLDQASKNSRTKAPHAYPRRIANSLNAWIETIFIWIKNQAQNLAQYGMPHYFLKDWSFSFLLLIWWSGRIVCITYLLQSCLKWPSNGDILSDCRSAF